MRKGIIGVMGSGSETYTELSYPIGTLIAERGYHLLNGGGQGVMASVSEAFVQTHTRTGLCIGIIPGESKLHRDNTKNRRDFVGLEYNQWIEIPIRTHLPLTGEQGTDLLSRNHINVLSADILIVLPGGVGTYSEIQLRIEYGLPLLLFLGKYRVAGKTSEELQGAFDSTLVTAVDSIREMKKLIPMQKE